MINRCWRYKEAGLFLCLIFHFSFFPPAVNANSFPVLQGNTMPQFIYEADGTLVAQTSEIAILLEKQIPPGINIEEKPENPDKENLPSREPGASREGMEIETSSEEMEQTASALEAAPSVEFYEELDDPFGPAEGKEIPALEDPYVDYNRWMYNVNEGLYENVMEPLAKGWRYFVPEDFRIVLRNAFDNALAPVKLFSSLVQGDFDKSGRVLGRVLINTTAGLGGMLDVAGQEYGIDSVNEDFDQALGYYDVPTGPYIILPFFGPSTTRNVAGRVVDSLLNPSIFFAPSFIVSSGITVAETTNDVSFIIEDKKALEEGAIDEYESVRDFYHQYREGLVRE